MNQWIRMYSLGTAHDSSTFKEILISNSRYIIVITVFFLIVSAIIISGFSPTELMSILLLISVVFGLLSYLAYRLIERYYTMTHIVWQIGLLAVIVSAALALQRPEVLLLVSLLPLLATITLGWFFGLLAELVIIVLIAWTGQQAGALALSPFYAFMVPVLGAFSGLLGWSATTHLITLAEWSFYNFNLASKNLAEAREQQLELTQTQEDLSKAYQELARLTDRLKVLQRIAEEARQAKSEFVANVSHELRTPLNMIIGFTEVIAQSPSLYGKRLPTSLMTDVIAIQRNSQHLLHLVNDVLDLSQVDSGRMALSQGWANAKQILEESSAVVKSLFDSKGLYLNLEIEEDIPPVFCDRTRIRQVLINLLSNAGRFTNSGGVCIRGRVEKEYLVVSVADTGPGIPEEDQLRIFEPFQQVDNSIRRQFGGSGLGLTISKQFVEMHGGKMWLESHPGQGTTFYFSLPITKAFDDGQTTPAQNARRSLIPGDEYGYRVRTRHSKASVPVLVPRLVIFEKEQGLDRLLRRYLENTEILRVDTIEDAVAELNRSPAQALVVNLPPSDEAAELTGTVQAAIPFGTPVISCWIPGEVEAARQLGVVQYLVKPLTREKLLTILGELPIPGGLRTILVADDEPDELHLFARMLESDPNGYQVLQVTNGKRALNMMRSRHPDLVLLDLVMPVMDGFQVLEEKQKDPTIRDIPVIVISSRDPAGEAITGNTLKVNYNSGFSTTNLLAFIEAVTQIFSSGQSNHHQAQPPV